VADDYSPVPGKFKAMQWDGTNDVAFKAWVQSLTTTHTFTPTEWTRSVGVAPDGGDVLSCYWTPDTYSKLRMQITQGNWAVFGPYWGTDPTLYWNLLLNSPWSELTPAEFARQYGAV
jgi:hypothetical protein